MVPPHLDPPPAADIPAPEAPEPPPGTDVPAPAPAVDGSHPHSVTVRRGDHVWSLSERHLVRVLGRSDLGEHEIARYWVRVIEANRYTLRSGNPDLIYPGEIIVLPIVTTAP